MSYQPNLYVHREEFFEKLQQWLSDPSPECRLRSLVGSPGIGKSWFMADVYHRLRQDSNYLPIWLDLSERAVYPNEDSKAPPEKFPDCKSTVGRQQWLRWVMEQGQVQESCPNITSFNPTVAFNSVFYQFVEDLIQKCGSYTPVLLVDGYGEVGSVSVIEYLQEHIFATFLQPGCTRILIARRDEQELSHSVLSWNEEICRLPGFTETEKRQDQIKKLRQEHTDHLNVLDALEPYLSVVPLINHMLFERAVVQHPHKLGKNDLQHCVAEIADRAKLSPESKEMLHTITQNLDKTWTALELQKKTSIKLGNSDLEQLFRAGLVHQITGTSRYQIDEGLYSLLQQIQQIEVDGG